MSLLLVAIAAFVGVASLIGGVALVFRPDAATSRIENRLDQFTGSGPSAKEDLLKQNSVLQQPLDSVPGLMEKVLSHFGDFSRLLDQADVNLTTPQLAGLCAGLGAGGTLLGLVLRAHRLLLPIMALITASMPIFWLLWRRKRRLKTFSAQLPDAMDMLARSLRSGQSLASGFNMVAGEMSLPLSREFGRVFEEQNLGVSVEDSLRGMCDRVPNLDLRFFVTAVILQRQTGGDLAEILDKIGTLIRERFQIWGAVQALTGEGRLSGIVLMALPVALFVALYFLNPDYVMLLFDDPMGQKMLAGGVVLQVLGALVIRKIVTIKV
jgi:tight adherence protein B